MATNLEGQDMGLFHRGSLNVTLSRVFTHSSDINMPLLRYVNGMFGEETKVQASVGTMDDLGLLTCQRIQLENIVSFLIYL